MDSEQLRAAFSQTFSVPCEGVAVAPGRVNLIGEHTDYNQGFVLPCALDFATRVAYRPRQDTQVRVVAANYEGTRETFDLKEILAPGPCEWLNYVMGVYSAFLDREDEISGADLMIAGDVPQGAGLSSSAALEVALALAVDQMAGLRLNAETMALIGQSAENDFLGCQTGIMDQMIAALGRRSSALLLDCRTLTSQYVALPECSQLLVINSNVKRRLVGSEYNDRRKDCEEAAEIMGVLALRDVTAERLEAFRSQLSETQFRRARHVVHENRRTLEAAPVLNAADLPGLRRLMHESHQSLKRDFEVTIPETDYLVELVEEEAGPEGAARMTGGGFGGSVVAFVPPERVDAVEERLRCDYRARFQLTPSIYRCRPERGMRLE